MPSTYTTNKNLEMPAAGSYPNTWATPADAIIAAIDTSLGGSTTINVTGVANGIYPMQLSQYQPPNIVFNGILTANLAYILPIGVGGTWSIFNNTSGSFSLTFASAGGGLYALPQGQRTLLVCDGANVQLADGAAYNSILLASEFLETYATNAANAAQANAISSAETFATTIGINAQSAAVNSANATAATLANAAQSAAITAAETYANGTSIQALPGKVVLPGGLIFQWGFITASPAGEVSGLVNNLPYTNPHNTFFVMAIANGGAPLFVQSYTASQFTWGTGYTSGGQATTGIWVFAIGN